MLHLLAHLASTAALFFPHVEDPRPRSIGLGVPFTGAGFGGVLGMVIAGEADEGTRQQMVFRGGRGGFHFGCVYYLLSVAAQLISEL